MWTFLSINAKWLHFEGINNNKNNDKNKRLLRCIIILQEL